jgi:hypothetical protein
MIDEERPPWEGLERGTLRPTWIDTHLSSEVIYGLAKVHAVALL